MDIQKKFQTFLKEDVADSGQCYGRAMLGAPPGIPSVDDVTVNAANIQDPGVIDSLNAFLGAVSHTPVLNPYFAAKRIQDKLSMIGLSFDIPHFVSDRGSVEKPVSQFGGRSGYLEPKKANEFGYPDLTKDDGISHRIPGGLNIKFTWTKFKGLTTLDVQLVPGSNIPNPLKEDETNLL